MAEVKLWKLGRVASLISFFLIFELWSATAISSFSQNENITLVHLVYMTHLDVGFTNFAKNVCELYFNSHFPTAIKTANELKARGGPEQYIYTSHPWLILEYLDGAAGCTDQQRTPDQIKLLEDAIRDGIITWHAKPFNEFAEVMDPSLFSFGLDLGRQLDSKFQKPPKIGGSHKDILGIPRATVPLLVKKNITALHIGVNSACQWPAVPQAFVWRHLGYDLVTFLHYGWPPYGHQIIIPGFNEAFVYDFGLDNTSPPNATSVIQFWADLQKQFPNAKIIASSLDAFAASVIKNFKQKLPVITQEMGDTWAYGIGADPFRTSVFREISRLRNEWLNTKQIDPNSVEFQSFSRRLMKIPEHNWGLSVGQYLNSDEYSKIWTNSDFYNHRNSSDFQLLDAGWREARSFLFNSTHSLPDHLKKQVHERIIQNIMPKKPDLKKYKLLYSKKSKNESSQNPSFGPFKVGNFEIGFDSNGAIDHLVHLPTQRIWATSQYRLGFFFYHTFSVDDFNRFNRQYNPGCGPPCGDFSKIGMQIANPESKKWYPQVSAFFNRNNEFLIELQIDDQASIKYGAPKQVYLNVRCDVNRIDFELSWFEKPATRLAEAMWFSNRPNPAVLTDPHRWIIDVMGDPVNPYDVVANGTRHLFAIWEGVSYEDSHVSFHIESPDCPLVAPGDTDHLLFFDGDSQPACENGMHFNLFNNLWGTAFPIYYSDDARFRFTFHFRR